MNEFNIRPANAADIPFIYSTWVKSYRYDGDMPKTRNSVFFPCYQRVIDHILDRPNNKVSVACHIDAPETILGYMAYEPMVLHYAFTKDALRRFGIATQLFIDAFGSKDAEITCTHRTGTANPIINRHEQITFNPFNALYKMKEETNGTPKETKAIS